jgi:hypothetical protein
MSTSTSDPAFKAINPSKQSLVPEAPAVAIERLQMKALESAIGMVGACVMLAISKIDAETWFYIMCVGIGSPLLQPIAERIGGARLGNMARHSTSLLVLLMLLAGCGATLPDPLPLEKLRAFVVATCTEPAPPQCDGVPEAFNELVTEK